jgi:hypothetical protein
MAYRIDRLPAPISKAAVLNTLIKSAESGSGKLPDGWEVTWRWQNKKCGIWHEDSFQKTVSESRAQFLELMGARLRRDLRKLGVGGALRPKGIRRSIDSDPEEEEREERREEQAEREAERKRKKRKALKKKKKKKQ